LAQVPDFDRVNFFLNQNDVVLIKKSTGCNRVFDRVNRVTPGFSFLYFFFNSAQFQLRVGRVPGDPPGRVSKLYS
jgi:hypothetical protein